MHVCAEALSLPAHHHRHLGMGLQVDEAVDDLDAGALQVARPADVRLLVEARLELDQRGHRLAPFGRLDQRLDDRSAEHTSELQSLMRNSYAVFCLKKKNNQHVKQHLIIEER